MYPSLMQMLNCSKETKLSTALSIDDSGRVGPIRCEEVKTGHLDETGMPTTSFRSYEVEEFFVNAIYAFENAVYVENQYFGLPDYGQMEDLIRERLIAEGRIRVDNQVIVA